MMAALIAIILTLFSCFSVRASTIFVDNCLTDNCNGNYSVVNRNCAGKDGIAFNNIAGAAEVAIAGDTVLIRSGIYREQIAPKNSGSAMGYIVFKNYKEEDVIISDTTLSPAIWIFEKDYIIIEGLTVLNVQRWFNCLGSKFIIVKNNTFKNAIDAGGSSKTGLFYQESNNCKILGNNIDNSTQDNVALIQSDYNLIEGNSITRAVHTLWTIKCGNHNIIRNNYFHNSFEKIGEIFDCEGVGYGDFGYGKITSLNKTMYNIVENNTFAFTAPAVDRSPYSGIQYAGQHGIIRRNVFYNCTGTPIDLTLYENEAKFNYNNRIYHNVMYNNHFGGISVPAFINTGYTCYGNIFRNNILYKNDYIQYDTRWNLYKQMNGKPLQVFYYGSSSILSSSSCEFENNNIFNNKPDELYIITYGDRTAIDNPDPHSLSWWENNHPNKFSHNLQTDPEFIDSLNKNFRLYSQSPMIDSAMFLTRTIGSGYLSTTMMVEDAGYFSDGFGINGLSGDTIQLQGQTETAIISAIDYKSKILTLSNSLTWTSGQKLSLKYWGKAPDIGAYEMHSNSVGTKDIENYPDGISIYPNPTKGIIYIKLKENAANDMIINVFDFSGQSIYSVRHKIRSEEPHPFIDLSNQMKGIYLLLISTEKWNINKKIILN
jgi:hypothetical protein